MITKKALKDLSYSEIWEKHKDEFLDYLFDYLSGKDQIPDGDIHLLIDQWIDTF